MTREELRKKRQEIAKNNGYSEYSSKKYSQQPMNQQPVTPQISTWDRVQSNLAQSSVSQERLKNTRNLPVTSTQPITQVETKKKGVVSNLINDLGNIGKNFGLGVKSATKNSLYYIEDLTENKFGDYRRYNQSQTALKNKEEETEKLLNNNGNANINNMKLPVNPNERNIQQLSEEEKNKILLPKKQESGVLKTIDESISKDEEKIQQNVENTSNKVLRKVAELTPSIAQSVTGMGASVINPAVRIRILANICWRWIYKRSRKEWIYWKSSYAIWNYNG